MNAPITLAQIGPDSNAACMDHLAAACRYQSPRFPYARTDYFSNAKDYHRNCMTEADRLAFDCFLVRMKDELGAMPGSPADRFATRVQRMAELSRKS